MRITIKNTGDLYPTLVKMVSVTVFLNVSECTSIFSSLQYSEIDIATHEDYRGQGLASSIVKTFIDHCLENDIIPRWDCDILNKSSIKLAGKSGFGNPVQYSIFV